MLLLQSRLCTHDLPLELHNFSENKAEKKNTFKILPFFFSLNSAVELYPGKFRNDQTHCNKTHEITFNINIIVVPQLCLFLEMSGQ